MRRHPISRDYSRVVGGWSVHRENIVSNAGPDHDPPARSADHDLSPRQVLDRHSGLLNEERDATQGRAIAQWRGRATSPTDKPA